MIGRRVAVYGGGNTAMDAARVAKRLGAEDTVIVYRRDRDHMPAHAEEAEDAEREGVRINWLRTINAFDGPDLTVEVMEVDEAGRTHGDRTDGDAGGRHADYGARPGDRLGLHAHGAGRGIRRRRQRACVRIADDRLSRLFAGGDMVPASAP